LVKSIHEDAVNAWLGLNSVKVPRKITDINLPEKKFSTGSVGHWAIQDGGN
jgi:hypothetical protein